jgi:hypothetical protein
MEFEKYIYYDNDNEFNNYEGNYNYIQESFTMPKSLFKSVATDTAGKLAKEAAGKLAKEATEKLAKEAAEKTAKQSAKEAAEKLAKVGAALIAGAGAAAHAGYLGKDAKEKTNEVVGQVKEKTNEVVSQVKDKANDAVGDLKDKVDDVVGDLKEKFSFSSLFGIEFETFGVLLFIFIILIVSMQLGSLKVGLPVSGIIGIFYIIKKNIKESNT